MEETLEMWEKRTSKDSWYEQIQEVRSSWEERTFKDRESALDVSFPDLHGDEIWQIQSDEEYAKVVQRLHEKVEK
eukprot:1257131-Karenia_brevis.AAC.1